jgi:hypothetical protein
MTESTSTPQLPHLVAALVVCDGRIALVVRGSESWRAQAGYTFIPIELPGTEHRPGTQVQETIDRAAQELLGQPARIEVSAHLYGPSAAHAIDRLDAGVEQSPLPLLRLERVMPLETGEGSGFRHVQVHAYLAALAGDAQPQAGTTGILWAAPQAVRAAMRGLPMGELLARADIRWQAHEPVQVPEDALAYVPGDYGERQLLRVVAKYGPEALFQVNGDDKAKSDTPG